MKSTGTERSSEDDLRVLRKNRRTTMDTSMLGAMAKRPETAVPDASAARSAAASKLARRSSHIPQIGRSTSSENINNNAAADFRGPVAVPTAALARKLNISTAPKDTAGGAGSASNSPHEITATAGNNRLGTKIPTPTAAEAASKAAAESKLRAPAKPTATEARSAAEKQALLQQKQKQLAAEEEALLKLQRSVAAGSGRAPQKSLRSNAAAEAVPPSPPASPPRASSLAARQAANVAKSAASREPEGRRSPPPPYEWEEPAPPPSQPPPRHNLPTGGGAAPATTGNNTAVTKTRSSYPPRAESSPSNAESEQDSDFNGPTGAPYNTDTDSYDNYYDSAQDDALEEDHRSEDIVDMAIRVVVRKRPISKRELANGDRDVMEVRRSGRVLVHEPKTKVDLTKIIETQDFRFDDAFEAHETNEVIYGRTIKHLVNFVFDGGKASCFAYGQTGSGT
jgi:hypothetical protein